MACSAQLGADSFTTPQAAIKPVPCAMVWVLTSFGVGRLLKVECIAEPEVPVHHSASQKTSRFEAPSPSLRRSLEIGVVRLHQSSKWQVHWQPG